MKRLIKFIATVIAIFIALTLFSLELRGRVEKEVRKQYDDIKHTEWVMAAKEVRQMESDSTIGNATNSEVCDEIR